MVDRATVFIEVVILTAEVMESFVVVDSAITFIEVDVLATPVIEVFVVQEVFEVTLVAMVVDGIKYGCAVQVVLTTVSVDVTIVILISSTTVMVFALWLLAVAERSVSVEADAGSILVEEIATSEVLVNATVGEFVISILVALIVDDGDPSSEVELVNVGDEVVTAEVSVADVPAEVAWRTLI